ncbi:hypothetical protein OIDMADRAFT_169714 [Oidiodendron maius Zn]|uniref:F-box domain-containing protein n=1 Tax=Oidiodendron maius (strain Zn) TaxID=913774 RepID=A0A0C3GLC6_OIDMZ|nr:hypothetical protein OIDMADRAFT_169714 [Oidiodendron maius Zn]
MGQYWEITAPNLRQSLPVKDGFKLGEMLFDGTPSRLVPFLVTPLRASNLCPPKNITYAEQLEVKAYTKRPHSGDCVQRPTFPMMRLPVEAHYLIFESLDLVSMLYLGLTNQYFWNLFKEFFPQFIKRSVTSCLGAWAGTNVIVVGDYADDLPDGLLTDAISKEMEEGIKDGSEMRPATLYDLSSIRYQTCVPIDQIFDERLPNLLDLGKKNTKDDGRGPRDIEDIVSLRLTDFLQDEQLWVLRNLSTYEYVRAEAIALKPEYIHGPFLDYIGFGEVIMSRASWSSDPSCAMGYDRDITRGVWAGDRFDIVPLRCLADGNDKQKWIDISDKVVRKIADIWDSEFGSNWREDFPKYLDRLSQKQGQKRELAFKKYLRQK